MSMEDKKVEAMVTSAVDEQIVSNTGDEMVDGIVAAIAGYVKKPDWFKQQAEVMIAYATSKGFVPKNMFKHVGEIASRLRQRCKVGMGPAYPPARITVDGKTVFNPAYITLDNCCRAIARWYAEMAGMERPDLAWSADASAFFNSHKQDIGKLADFVNKLRDLIDTEEARIAADKAE